MSNARLKTQAELVRKKFLDFVGNPSRLNLYSLYIEMNVVAVVFTMTAHRGVEIISRDFLRSDDFRGNGVTSCYPFIRVFRFRVRSHGFAIAQRCSGGPDQPGFRRMGANCLDELGEGVPILCLIVLPPVHAIIEMDDIKFRLVQNQFDFLK